MNRKTILITVGHGIIARNLLRTNFIKKLKEAESLRIIILSPISDKKEFIDEFSSENVILEKLVLGKRRNIRENLFNTIHSHLVFTETSKLKIETQSNGKVQYYIKYYARLVSSVILGKVRWIRDLIAYLDRLLLPDTVNIEIFDKYKPDLVFVTSLMFRQDFDVLKRALSNGIPTIGMVKSWDNLVKDIPIRIRPHKLIVWNSIMKEHAVKYQLFDPKNILMTGIPQFDFYEQKQKYKSRDEFVGELGGDPKKKIIMFAGCGRWTPNDPDIAKIIYEFIQQKKLSEDCQLLIRPHFIWPEYIQPLLDFKGLENVIVDDKWKKESGYRDYWDPTEEEAIRLAESLYYSDILITSFSTMSIDMTYFDKPVINIAFDGFKNLPAEKTMARWYGTRYYMDVLKFNATTLVYNEIELLKAINQYLCDPMHNHKNRLELKNAYSYIADGKSSERLAGIVLNELS